MNDTREALLYIDSILEKLEKNEPKIKFIREVLQRVFTQLYIK